MDLENRGCHLFKLTKHLLTRLKIDEKCAFLSLYKFDVILDPTPSKEDPTHYKKFDELYGQPTTEENRPSLHEGKGRLSKKEAGFRISGETVRAIVTCTNCMKPRYLLGIPFQKIFKT